jgi:hypothetical protein
VGVISNKPTKLAVTVVSLANGKAYNLQTGDVKYAIKKTGQYFFLMRAPTNTGAI